MPLSILVPVAVSLYVDRRAMVENPIQNGRSNNVISEDISPLAIGLIGCEYDRPFLMKNHSLPSNIGGIQPHAPRLISLPPFRLRFKPALPEVSTF